MLNESRECCISVLVSVLSMKSVYLGIGGGGVGKKMGGWVYSGLGTLYSTCLELWMMQPKK